MTTHEYSLLLAELRAMRRRQWVLLVIVMIQTIWLVNLTFGSDVQLAFADREKIPRDDWSFVYYFGFETLPEEARVETRKILRFAVCSLSSAVVIEQQLPVDVGDICRIDTRGLGWEKTFPKLIKANYPYTPRTDTLPLLIRADWFIQFAMDQTVGKQAYHELIFGEPIQKLDQFFAKLGAVQNSPLEFGHIEDTSGVAVNKTRMLKTVPTNARTDVWVTYDSAVIDEESDPLEHLDRNFKYDASEVIGALTKSSARTGQYGNLQVYALANAEGVIQEKAPADIVVDSTAIRGVEIRNAVSCIACHVEGLRPPKVNALREYIRDGADVYADYKAQQDIERFHLTSLDTLIMRHNEDYAAILKVINGLSPAENAAAFKNVIQRYDAPLSIDQAARELSSTGNELRLALGRAGRLPARVAQLAHGALISRQVWEQQYRRVGYHLQQWSNLSLPRGQQ